MSPTPHCVFPFLLFLLMAPFTSGDPSVPPLCPADTFTDPTTGACLGCENSPAYKSEYLTWASPKALFSLPGSPDCVACPPGSFYASAPMPDHDMLVTLAGTSRGCINCPKNSIRADLGGANQSACLMCPVGYVGDGSNVQFGWPWLYPRAGAVVSFEYDTIMSGSVECLPCLAGTTSDGKGGPCTPCLPGSYSPTPGNPCLPCPPSTFPPPPTTTTNASLPNQCDGAALTVAWNATGVAGRVGVSGFQDGSVSPGTGAGLLPTFRFPTYMAATPDGTTLYIADSGNNAIRRVVVDAPVTGVGGAPPPPVNVSTFYISPDPLQSGALGPMGIAYAPQSSLLLVSDWNTHSVYTLGLSANDTTAPSSSSSGALPVRTPLAGSGASGYSDGRGTQATFFRPAGLAVDEGAGLVYCADYFNSRVRRLDLGTGGVVTIAGNGGGGARGATVNGIGTAATFNLPLALALFIPKGMLYVADTGNGVLRAMELSTGLVSTLAGQPGSRPVFMGAIPPSTLFPVQCLDFTGMPTFVDGSTQYATMCAPTGVAVDASGYVYFLDNMVDLLRVVSPGGLVSSLAGSRNASGFTGVSLTVTQDGDGVGERAGFTRPVGLAIDATTGTVFVSSTVAHTIRKVTPLALVSAPTFPPGLVAHLAQIQQSLLPPPPKNCTPGYFCGGGGGVEVACTLPWACLPQGCAPGFTGFLCAQCSQPPMRKREGGTFFLGAQGECVPCAPPSRPTSSPPFWWATIVGALAWLVVATLGVDRLVDAVVWMGGRGLELGAKVKGVFTGTRCGAGTAPAAAPAAAAGATTPNAFLPIAWDMVIELLNRLSLYSRLTTFPFPGTFKAFLVWVGSVWGVNASFTGMECAIPGWSYPNTFALTLCVGAVGIGLSQWVSPRLPFERSGGGGVGSRGSTFPALFFPLLVQAAWQTLAFAKPTPGGGTPFLVIQPSLGLSPSLWWIYAAGGVILVDLWARFWDCAGKAPSKATFLQLCGGGRGGGVGAGGSVMSSKPAEERVEVSASLGVVGEAIPLEVAPLGSRLNTTTTTIIITTTTTLTAALAPIPLPAATITAAFGQGGAPPLSPAMAVLKWACYLLRSGFSVTLPFAITRDFVMDPYAPIRMIFLTVTLDILVTLFEWVVFVGVAAQPYPPLPVALYLATILTVGAVSKASLISHFPSTSAALVPINTAFLVLAPTLAWALVKWPPFAWCRKGGVACGGRKCCWCCCPKSPSSLVIRRPHYPHNASTLDFANIIGNSRRTSNPVRAGGKSARGGGDTGGEVEGLDTDPQ